MYPASAAPHSQFDFYVIMGNACTLLLQVGGPLQAQHTDFILLIRVSSSVANVVVVPGQRREFSVGRLRNLVAEAICCPVVIPGCV